MARPSRGETNAIRDGSLEALTRKSRLPPDPGPEPELALPVQAACSPSPCPRAGRHPRVSELLRAPSACRPAPTLESRLRLHILRLLHRSHMRPTLQGEQSSSCCILYPQLNLIRPGRLSSA